MSMRHALAGALLAASTAAFATDLVVIANPEVQMAPSEVRDVFLGNRQFAGNLLLRPVDNGPIRALFVDRALAMDEVRYESHWTKKSFREGLLPPALKSGDLEVINFVRRHPGAVGYVASEAPEGVRVIARY